MTQVRGSADQRLRKPDTPLDPSNRRLSLIVQYIVKDNDSEEAKTEADRNKTSQDSMPTAPEKPPATK